ncbi:MAG: amidohydrolase family protein [Deltaproteobacteria bacterium]|nr:amidohydrolase family protein [Deltaproteobacteria bacterium]
MTYDLLIENGTIVDGTGSPPYRGDVAIRDGKIVAVGEVEKAPARETIDAEGQLVTPGWVDIHTHFDGQATWDPLLTPTCWHGVTTVVMGNCGVGFAPVKPERRKWLVELMEGVEDIPGTALSEGIQWDWETFPEFLDALEKHPHVMDIGTQIPHGAVRGYVMGERGAKNEPATPEDIEAMAAIVKQGIEAGALGFSSSRTLVHRAIDGEPVPGTFAAEDELFGIGRALKEVGAGVFELAPAGVMGEDLAAPLKEVAWMRKLSREIGRPVSFALLQIDQQPTLWKEILEICSESKEEGSVLRPQVGSRPTMLLIGLQTFSPYSFRPTYAALADLPLDQRVRELRKPEVKAKILSEEPVDEDPLLAFVLSGMHKIFVLGDVPDYEPEPEKSIEAIAKARGLDADDVLYDEMLELDGKALLMVALVGYHDGNLEAMREMIEYPDSAFGLGDGGAHVGAICDASMTTYLLTHWTRDRERGPKLPLEFAVKKMTKDTADLYALNDRGQIRVGYKADLNVIDYDRLRLDLPYLVNDLPGGAKRLIQKAEGYTATIVSGEVTFRNGEETGARPGAVVRGAQSPVTV